MGKQNIQAENVYYQETTKVSRYNATVQANLASQRKKFFHTFISSYFVRCFLCDMRLVDNVSKTKRFERHPETVAFLLDPVVDVFDTPRRALSAFFLI